VRVPADVGVRAPALRGVRDEDPGVMRPFTGHLPAAPAPAPPASDVGVVARGVIRPFTRPAPLLPPFTGPGLLPRVGVVAIDLPVVVDLEVDRCPTGWSALILGVDSLRGRGVDVCVGPEFGIVPRRLWLLARLPFEPVKNTNTVSKLSIVLRTHTQQYNFKQTYL
jgi:hypothetical protein